MEMEMERESMNSVENHSANQNKAKQIIKEIAKFILLIGFLLLLVFVLSSMVVPIEINLASVALSEFNNSRDVLKVPVSLNLSLTVIFSLTNQDHIDVQYDNVFSELDYQGHVAKSVAPKGILLAGHTKLVTMKFKLMDLGFSVDIKDSSPICLFAEIRRTVRNLFSKYSVADSISCDFFVNVANRSITVQNCDNYLNDLGV